MPGDASYLYLRAAELLGQAAAGLAQVRTGHAPPSRAYVSFGDPAAELPLNCDGSGQLTVHLDQQRLLDVRDAVPRAGTPGNRPRTGLVIVAPMVVTLFRCWPQGTSQAPIPAGDLDLAAKGLLQDLHCLVQWLVQKRAAKTLFPTSTYPVEQGDVGIGNPKVAAPSGGTAGFVVPVDLWSKDPGP